VGVAARETSPIEVVVLHDLPPDLTAMLTDGHGGHVRAVCWGALDGPDDLIDLERLQSDVLPGPVLCLPIDGPPAAAELAVAGLARRELDAVVAPWIVGAAPPDWWVLDLLVDYGARLAIDLRRVQWHGADGLWWTTPRGPVRLPITVDDPRASAGAAGILRVAEGQRRSGPLGDWFKSAELAREAPTAAGWTAALGAQYVHMAVGHLSGDGGRGREPAGVAWA
jgi:hypothetical protein